MAAQPPESIDYAGGIPSFAEIAPVLDRLRELAIEHLDDPSMIRVEGWDNGRFDAVSHHNTGLVDGDESRLSGERIIYDLDREAFVRQYIEWEYGADERDVYEEEVIESFTCPIDVIGGEDRS